jgi:hypothetical protein
MSSMPVLFSTIPSTPYHPVPQLTKHLQTLHHPADEARRIPTNPRRTTQTTTRLPPSSNLPHANKLLQLSLQSNNGLGPLWCVLLLRRSIPGLPTLWMASRHGYDCCGIWVNACGCKGCGEVCDGVPVYVSWDQWRGTFGLGYREGVCEEADCVERVDYSWVECYQCGLFGSLGLGRRDIRKKFYTYQATASSVAVSASAHPLVKLHVQSIHAPGILSVSPIPCAFRSFFIFLSQRRSKRFSNTFMGFLSELLFASVFVHQGTAPGRLSHRA